MDDKCGLVCIKSCFFGLGIWSAALNDDVERVKSFLQKGTDPNVRDQGGYTALVS